MAQDDRDQDSTGGGAGGDVPCRSAKELLDEVTRKINEFEAQKLGELKTALDAFVKNQDQLVEGYRTKYPTLRKTWCERQTDVERLYAHIKCEFPLDDEKWQKLIETCICRKKHDLTCLKKRITKRKHCCAGPLERVRDAARAALKEAETELEIMQTLAQKIADALAGNLNVIGEIEKLPAAERAAALYLFWFKLLPNHKKLAPSDIAAECKDFGDEYDPKKLCESIYGEDCEPKDDGCAPPEGYQEPESREPRGPWLLPPDKYREALDCAWEKYHNAKAALADAEGKFKAAPDDLASLEKKLTDDSKALDDQIKKCLKEEKPKDKCCTPTTGETRSA